MVRQNGMNAYAGLAPSGNRYMRVLEVAQQAKAANKPLQRPSLAEEFYRENPMPWLLDADPVDEPDKASA